MEMMVLRALLFLFFALATEAALADPEDLAPLGKRKYLVRPDKPTVITPIEIKHRKGKTVMRDPILPGAKDIAKLVQPELKPAKEEVPEFVPAHLKFKYRSILGRYAEPRLDFDGEALSVPLAEPRLGFDPISRIFRTDEKIERR